MVGNPLRTVMLLAGCTDFLAGLTGPRDTIKIRVSPRQRGGIMVSFTSAHIGKGIRRDSWEPALHEEWNELEAPAAGLHARIGLIPEKGMRLIVFETEWI